MGVKDLDRVHLFAKADKTDRLAGHGAHRQRRAAAPVAVHPGQHDAGNPDLAVEFGGDIDRILTGQTVDDQQRLARVGDIADGLHLIHQHLIDMQTAGGIQHIDIIAAQRRLLLGALGDLHGVFARNDRQRIDADLLAKDRQLLHRGGAVGVQRRHQHALFLAILEALGQFCRGRGLARALQAHHQDRCRRVVDAQRIRRALALQDLDQLVMDDLDHLLAGGDRFRHRRARGLGGHRLYKVARHRQRDVGLKQGHAHLAHGGGDVILAQRALFGQPVEDAAQAVGKVLEHGGPPCRSKTRMPPWAQRADGGRSPQNTGTGRDVLPGIRRLDTQKRPPSQRRPSCFVRAIRRPAFPAPHGRGQGLPRGRRPDRRRRRIPHP